MNLNTSTTLGSLAERHPRGQELGRLRPELEEMHRSKQGIRNAVALLDKACGIFAVAEARVAELENIRRLSPGRVSDAEFHQAVREAESAHSTYRRAYDHYRERFAAYGEADPQLTMSEHREVERVDLDDEVAVSSGSVKTKNPDYS